MERRQRSVVATVRGGRSSYGCESWSWQQRTELEEENPQPPKKARRSHRSGRRASASRWCSHDAPRYSFQRLSPEPRLRAS